MKRKILLVSALLTLTAAAVQAWDEGGHLLIGELAARKLQPQIVKKIEALLPLLDTRFNEGHPYNLVTAGVWLDDMRGLGKANLWAHWHYIDVPCAGDAFVEPPPPNALWALDQATSVLRSKTAEPKARAEALAQIMHLVGDIHQPLHTADRNDRGGNDVRIVPLGELGNGPANLHAFWDAAYRYDSAEKEILSLWRTSARHFWPGGPGQPGVIAEQALALRMRVPKTDDNTPSSQQPWHQWAYQTHMIACESGWPKEPADAKTGAVQLTPAFVHAAHEIAEKQIVKAGERLAALLNALLEEDQEMR